MMNHRVHVVHQHVSPRTTHRQGVENGHVAGQTVTEETIRTDGTKKEIIVVEIDELFRQPLNPMQVQLYWPDAEGGKILLGDEVLMTDEVQSLRIQVQPLGLLSGGDKMHLAHPRRKLLDAPEEILEVVPIPIAYLRVVVTPRCLSVVFLEFLLPNRVASVHPRNDNVYVTMAVFHLDPGIICKSPCCFH